MMRMQNSARTAERLSDISFEYAVRYRMPDIMYGAVYRTGIRKNMLVSFFLL